ncbi:MAG: cytochrome c [Pirellulaceae bacterium]|nr:cytochrome c [Pirellulaceae bacterium]
MNASRTHRAARLVGRPVTKSQLVLAVWLISAATLFAQGVPARKRVRPPEFDPRETAGIFFSDVFRDAVQGSRPTSPGVAPAFAPGGMPAVPTSPGAPATPVPAPGSGWSQWIAASSLEDEIKAIKLQVDRAVTTPNQFRSGDYNHCRRHFSVLAMLFGIIEEFDGDVRWKSSSAAMRQAFARAAANCKTGSDQAYNEAKLRKLDLEDAIGGGSVNLPEGKPRENWAGVCDRAPLMQRLEIALQEQLQPKTANQGDFRSNVEELLREAQMISAIGRVLKQDGMMDAGDDDYDQWCDSMSTAAKSLIEAIKSNEYDRAVTAVGQIGQSCSGCHELYR